MFITLPFVVCAVSFSQSTYSVNEDGSGPYAITFPAGVTSFPFDVLINDDDVLEGNEDFTLTIDPSSLLDGVTGGNPGSTAVTIVDNDRKS